MARDSLPKNQRDPSEHIQFIIEVISQLFKCVTFKKLWICPNSFAELVNFIHKSHILLLKQWKWFPPKSLILLIMCGYTVLGVIYMDWFHGKTNDPQTNLADWWEQKIQDAWYNLFINSDKNSSSKFSSTGNIIVGICGVAGYIHR